MNLWTQRTIRTADTTLVLNELELDSWEIFQIIPGGDEVTIIAKRHATSYEVREAVESWVPPAPSTVSVLLISFGAMKIKVIKAVRGLTGLGLKEAKQLVESTPAPLKEDISPEEAGAIKKAIEEVGGRVEIH